MPVRASARAQALRQRIRKKARKPLTRRGAVPVPAHTPLAGYSELDDEVGVVGVTGDVSAERGEVERREDLCGSAKGEGTGR